MALPRDPGSTANTAHDLGNLSDPQNITEFIGSTDTRDIYKFSLTETSDLSLLVDNDSYSGSLGAYLYIDSNANGQIDDSEYLYGDTSGSLSINSTLGAADYFVSIDRRRDTTNTNYNLNLSAISNPPSIDTDPGSTANTAHDLGNLSDPQNITEFIGSTDTRDIYKFSLTETSDLSLLVDNDSYSGSLGAYLYIDSNANGQIDDSEYLYGDTSGSLSINSALGAADYFVSIDRRRDTTNTNYNLNLSAISNPPSIDTDPGNSGSEDNAYAIENINLDTSEDNRSVTEFIGSTDTRDVYKFSLTQNTNLSLLVDNDSYSGSLGAYLYIDSNANGQIDDSEYLYGDTSGSLSINSTLGAADYFVSIDRRRDTTNTNYKLDLTYTADPLSIVTVEAQDAEAKEEGTNAGKFRITRDGYTSEPYTVNYEIATGKGQATNGTDYEELSGSVTIPAEAYYVDLFVNPVDDDVVEPNEEVTITLREVDGDLGTGTTQTATVTIEDNDVIPTFTIEAADSEANEEGEATGKFRIRHDVNTNKPQTVNYRIATGNGQAVNGEDYQELSGSVTIPEGQDYVELTVKPQEDFAVEGTEIVAITVEDINGNPGTQDNQTASINLLDNDRHPNFTIEATDSKANEEGAETANFRISHDGNTAISHTVNYQIATGNKQATNGVDYTELSGSITIPAEQNFVDLPITPIDDENVEIDEEVTITLKEIDGDIGTGSSQTATVTIEENDIELPTVYRFFRSDIGAHFYTASVAEKEFIEENLPQYAYEGEAYQTAPENADELTGAKPVYRFFNVSTGVHLYTMAEVEKDFIIENLSNYSFEGEAYNAYETQQEGTVPLYRFYHTIADVHFFTPSIAEKENIEENLPWYRLEGDSGIAFYVEPMAEV